MKKTLISITLLTACLFGTLSLASEGNSMQTQPLISRQILFSNPEKTSPAISPDGNKIAFLAPVKGVLNVWIADYNDFTHAKPLTHETKRDIRSYFWLYNNNYLAYAQDQNGDENSHLYLVNLTTHEIRDLTNFPKTQARVIQSSIQFPDELLVGLNNRNPEWHDVYLLNIVTGKLKLVEKNNQFDGFIADEDLKLRIARKVADRDYEFYFKNQTTGKWLLNERVPFENGLGTYYLGFNRAGNIAYKLDNQHHDKSGLYAYNFATHKKNLLAQDNKSDVVGALFNPITLAPDAWLSEYTKPEWHVLNSAVTKDFAYLKNAYPNTFDIVSQNLTDDKWIIRYYSDVQPSRFYLYERDPQTNTPLKLTFLFATLPALEKYTLAPMKPIIVKSRDGLDLVCYLTLPVNAKPNTPLPMVLSVHGGPWARDSWGLGKTDQWLANRGYAVLSVNYRGSTGFGKEFVTASNNEWAGKMHTDLIDAVNWAIQNKIADPKKIVIMGGSYGGYATLVGLTFTPNVFAGGVSIVGPSNLITLLHTIPPYWKPDLLLFKKRVGDIDTTEGRKLLTERSPLTFADRIKKPLLIMQGAHDPRVKKTEADQIVSSMKAKSIPVTYVLYHDEGHGFVREPNTISSIAIIEQFLAKILGGRAEPVKDDFKGANFSIVEGKQYIHGLK